MYYDIHSTARAAMTEIMRDRTKLSLPFLGAESLIASQAYTIAKAMMFEGLAVATEIADKKNEPKEA